MTDADAENILAALGHSARFEIFQTLLASSRPAGALAGAGRAPSTVSHHLAILARAGLIVATPSGRQINYALRADTLRGFADWLAQAAERRETKLLDELVDWLLRNPPDGRGSAEAGQR